MIFEHVFDGQRLRLKRNKSRGPDSLGDLSILVTSKFFYKDLTVSDALHQNAILVLHNEADWLKLFRRCFVSGVFNGSKLVKRIVWRVPGETIHTTRSFCQQVTQERLITVLLSLRALEVHSSDKYDKRVECYGTRDAGWADRSGHIAQRILHGRWNRCNEQYEVIWSALQEVLDSDNQVVLTTRFPAFSDCTKTGQHSHAWDRPSVLHYAILNLKDFRMRIDAPGETYGLPQPQFSLLKPVCKNCGQLWCSNTGIHDWD